MDILLVLVGLLAIGIAFVDIMATLFNAQANRTFSPALSRWMWSRLRRSETVIVSAGPVIVLTVIACWVLLIAIGWAFVYWPFFPESFRFGSEIPRPERDDFVTAVYFSLVSLATLGYGDITPAEDWVQIVAAIEALVGFGVLTASLTWTLSLYGVLARRRTLALEISIMDQTENERTFSLGDLHDRATASMLAGLTDKVIRVRDDLVQFPVAYYFHAGDRSADLSAQLGTVFRFAVRGQHAESPDVRFHSFALQHALESLCNTLSVNYPGCAAASVPMTVVAYAHDHGHADITLHDLGVDAEMRSPQHLETTGKGRRMDRR